MSAIIRYYQYFQNALANMEALCDFSLRRGLMKSGIRRVAAVIMTVLLLIALGAVSASASSVQQYSHGKLSRFNIQIVIDGSGSLVTGKDATDPSGLRYDAINLFLALLTNEGNDVGAIVFDDKSSPFILNTGLTSLQGKDQKIIMSDQIRKAGTGNDTDIGSALYAAVDELVKNGNNRPSVVILMSDGRTDLGNNKDALKQSLQRKEDAIVLAQENNIPIYTLCLNASPVADPSELSEIASRTNAQAIEVNSAEDLSDAFKQFYTLIFSTSTENIQEDTFPASGELGYDFEVPVFGAEEVNIIINAQGISTETLSSPSRDWTKEEVANSTMKGGIYRIIKLVNPEPGPWHINLEGRQGDKSMINILYNVNTEAVLETADGSSEYSLGEKAQLRLALAQEGTIITDPNVSKEYQAEATFENLSTGDVSTVPMVSDNRGGITCELARTDYSTYKVKAKAWCNTITLDSNELQLNFGNSAPALTDEAKDATVKVVVTPLTGRKKKVDVSKYFKDEQDANLTYSIASSTLVQDTADLDGSTLKVNTAKSKSGDVVVRATDSQGAYVDAKVRFKVTNLTIPIIVIILGAILVAAILGFIGYRASQPVFHGTVRVSNKSNGQGLPLGAFRGKVKLTKFPVGQCGLDPKSTFIVAKRNNGLEIESKKPFFIDGRPISKARLFEGQNEIWADEAQTMGIDIEVMV